MYQQQYYSSIIVMVVGCVRSTLASLLLWDEVVDAASLLELLFHVNEQTHSIHDNLNQLHLV